MKYVIKTVPTNPTKELEDLLNEMSAAGWDLYSMHEVESEEDEGYCYNCIFVTDDSQQEEENEDLKDVVNINSFKSQMEKMLSSNSSAYESCRDIQEKIKEQRLRISQIKKKLEAQEEAPISKNRKALNDEISQGLKYLDELKQNLIKTISPEAMYSKIKENKLSIHLSEEILDIVNPDCGAPLVAETVKVRETLADELGYVLPRITFEDDDELLGYEFDIKIRGLSAQKALTYPNYIMFFESDLNLTKKMKDAIYDKDIVTGQKVVWIPEGKTKNFWDNGITASEYVARVLKWTAIKCIDDLLDYSEVNRYIEIVGKQNLYLIENIIPDFVSIAEIRYILSSLLRECVSIKDIVFIFEKINDYAEESAKEDLLDKIRISLSRHISKNLPDNDGYIPVMTISDKSYEAIFGDSDIESDVIQIDGKKAEKLIKKINKKVKELEIDVESFVVLAPIEFRHMLYLILSQYIPNIKIVAKEEISSDYVLEVIGEI